MNRSIVVAIAIASFGVAESAWAQQAKRVPGYLGIRFEETVTQREDQRNDQIVVREVSKDSPAEKAGVRVGDEVLRINSMVASNGKFAALARTLVEGDTVRLRLKRDGKERDVTVIAGARPGGRFASSQMITIRPDSIRRLMLRYMDTVRVHLDSLRLPSIHIMPGDSTITMRIGPGHRIWSDSLLATRDSSLIRIFKSRPGERLLNPGDELIEFERELGPGRIFRHMELGARSVGGAELTDLDPAMRDYFKTDRGLLILRVAAETPADRAGLQPGDVIVKAKDRAIANVDDLRAIVGANPDGVKLEIMRKGETRSVELKTRR